MVVAQSKVETSSNSSFSRRYIFEHVQILKVYCTVELRQLLKRKDKDDARNKFEK
jgi:hypothetical protein